MATISDVAARAGVSTATVSRTLNGKTTVDPALAARVLAAAAELGYRPNGPARNLRKQETAVIALIISDVENPFFTAIARGAEDVAHSAGYSVVLCNSDDNPDKEREYIDVALQERMAGVLLSPSGRSANVEPLLRSGTPVVAVDRPLPSSAGDAVLVDSRPALGRPPRTLSRATSDGCITGPSGCRPPTNDWPATEGLRAAKRSTSNALVRRKSLAANARRQFHHRSAGCRWPTTMAVGAWRPWLSWSCARGATSAHGVRRRPDHPARPAVDCGRPARLRHGQVRAAAASRSVGAHRGHYHDPVGPSVVRQSSSRNWIQRGERRPRRAGAPAPGGCLR